MPTLPQFPADFYSLTELATGKAMKAHTTNCTPKKDLVSCLKPSSLPILHIVSSSLTKTQVLHIAKLARLKLSESEVDKMSKELTSILQYVEMLNEVKTDGVEPTAQVTDLESRLRDDSVKPSAVPSAALLECSPLPKKEKQIATPHAHG